MADKEDRLLEEILKAVHERLQKSDRNITREESDRIYYTMLAFIQQGEPGKAWEWLLTSTSL